jgi:hypothetical protein
MRQYAEGVSQFNHEELKGHKELSHDSFNPILQDEHPEVDEQAQTKPSCFQIREQLRHMDGGDLFNRLQVGNDSAADQ